MVSRFSASSCLVAALGLAAPGVAHAQPTPNEAAQGSEDPAAAQRESQPTMDDPPTAAETAADEKQAGVDVQAGEDPDAAARGDAAVAEDGETEDLDDDDLDDDEDLDDEEIYDEEGEVEVTESPAPERLPKLQRIGWYNVLGAFTLATGAGVLAGLAERQEDRASRIASGYDAESGAATLYADRQDQYEEILDRGQALETSAIVVGALAGATAVAAITIFAIDAKRRRPSATARRALVGPGSLEVRF